MINKKAKQAFEKVFESFHHPPEKKIDINAYIGKLEIFDSLQPHRSSFYTINNAQKLQIEYVSKGIKPCLGINPADFKNKSLSSFLNYLHPDDMEHWVDVYRKLVDFTINKMPKELRAQLTYVWNYRFRTKAGEYVNIIQNSTTLEFDTDTKPYLMLSSYTVTFSKATMDIMASVKLLNANGEYETVFFRNFSKQKLLDDLSNRELDIVRLLALNYSSKAISEELNISPHTVDTHRRRIIKKMGVNSTGELIGMVKYNPDII